MKRKLGLVAVSLGLFLVRAESNGATMVVPGDQASAEGNSNNGYPFNISDPIHGSLSSMRYQQGYSASQFSLTGPIYITQIAFRPDATFGSAFSSVLPSIQINLSTTTANPEALSPVFASNIGSDDTVVFELGALALASSDTGPVGGPMNFDIVINLTTPFLYDAANGNLLLDIRNYGGGRTTQFDSNNAPSDGVGRVNYAAVNASSGLSDEWALVTRFTIEPVPEPSIGALGLLALAAHAIRLRNKRCWVRH